MAVSGLLFCSILSAQKLPFDVQSLLKIARISDPQLSPTTCFVTPAPFTFGNAGRNILYGPGTNNVDFALHRFFPIPVREATKLEFRAEFFNFFNRPEFSMPAVTLNLAQTGQITATSIPNRQVQFALKLLW